MVSAARNVVYNYIPTNSKVVSCEWKRQRKMGFRTGFVISSVSFLYGIIFIASTYDFPMIYYSPIPEGSADLSERFYLSFFDGPKAITALLHGMMALGLIGLIAKLHRWTENAKYFDGGSLVCFMAAISMYGAVLIPTVRVLADPTNVALINRSAIATQREYLQSDYEAGKPGAVRPQDGPLTSEERVSALRILAACNTVAAALLAGVVIFQISGWYLDKQESDKAEKERKERYRKALEGAKEEERKKDV